MSAEAIVTMARKLYFGRPLTALDAHTVGCDASGLTYVPIPIAPAPEPGYAGLLSIILPSGMPVGQSYRVTVRQPVSYTHLDVYKRQAVANALACRFAPAPFRR